jgi:eukaryotic-like serine/threonine-protein kinase
MSSPAPPPSAATSLVGMTLPNGWTVTALVPRPQTPSGGNYSVSYLVETAGGAKGFLKALDYSRAFKSPNRVLLLNKMTQAYLHEKQLLQRCLTRKLRRVVRAIDFGEVDVPGFESGVDYIIFERAANDLRDQISVMDKLDDSWRLRTLHQISVGMMELHGSGIAHQDLKPSNVLNFPDGNKLSDLGRSACREVQCPFDDEIVAGSRAYAPPELLYDFAAQDFSQRRFGCDAYLLGSMAVYLWVGGGSTLLLLSELDEAHRPNRWKDGFATALPYLRSAFGTVLKNLQPRLMLPIAGVNLLPVVEELCEPDPALRGHPLNRRRPEGQYSIERYVSLFDLFARRVETDVLRD